MVKIQGIWVAVIQFFVDRAQSQISWTRTSISTETMLPILFIADTGDFIPKSAAFSSNIFMSSSFSVVLNWPPHVSELHDAPHPCHMMKHQYIYG